MEWPTDYDYLTDALDMTVREAIELEYYSRGTYPVEVSGDDLTISLPLRERQSSK